MRGVSEGITSVLSALGFLNPGLHLMQTLFIFLNLEQSSQLLRILLITCNFSFTSLWGIQSLQQMPHPALTRVLGEPIHKQLKLILCELTANLMAVSCPWGHNKGHMGLLKDPALYLSQNGASFNIPPAKPLLYSVVPASATAH